MAPEMGDDVVGNYSTRENDDEWKVVNHRPVRKKIKALVVGSSSDSTSIQGLDKYEAFYVSNLKPNTIEENLDNSLW